MKRLPLLLCSSGMLLGSMIVIPHPSGYSICSSGDTWTATIAAHFDLNSFSHAGMLVGYLIGLVPIALMTYRSNLLGWHFAFYHTFDLTVMAAGMAFGAHWLVLPMETPFHQSISAVLGMIGAHIVAHSAISSHRMRHLFCTNWAIATINEREGLAFDVQAKRTAPICKKGRNVK